MKFDHKCSVFTNLGTTKEIEEKHYRDEMSRTRTGEEESLSNESVLVSHIFRVLGNMYSLVLFIRTLSKEKVLFIRKK